MTNVCSTGSLAFARSRSTGARSQTLVSHSRGSPSDLHSGACLAPRVFLERTRHFSALALDDASKRVALMPPMICLRPHRPTSVIALGWTAGCAGSPRGDRFSERRNEVTARSGRRDSVNRQRPFRFLEIRAVSA
jgi:hypothetical protein